MSSVQYAGRLRVGLRSNTIWCIASSRGTGGFRPLLLMMTSPSEWQRDLVLVALIATIAGTGLAILGVELLGGRL